MAELTEAGCVGFSQAEVPIANTQVLLRALQYAATFGYTVWLRPQDAYLGKRRRRTAAPLATRLGLAGVPVVAETIALHTIFELMRATGARVHLCRLSQRRRRRAGARGQGRRPAGHLRREHQFAAPDRRRHRLLRRRARLAPPLRQQRDRDATAAPGWPTARSTRWSPTTRRSTRTRRSCRSPRPSPARPGSSCCCALALKWGAARAARDWRARSTVVSSRRASSACARPLQASAGRLAEGGVADLCMFDPAAQWTVTPDALRSQGKHTPFGGYELPGACRCTLVADASFTAEPAR